jgi:two-component system, OmpR family, heavy metal sensor histidine kinase CusS
MIRSLRARLLVQTSIAATVVLGLLGVALYFGIRYSVRNEYDHALQSEAGALASTAEQHGNDIVFDYAPDELPQFFSKQHPDYYEAWIDPNTVLRSPSLGSGDLPRPSAGSANSYRDITLPDGRPGRMIGMSFTTTLEENAEHDSAVSDRPHTVLLALAHSTHGMDESVGGFAWILVGWCGFAVALSGVLLYWIVGRAVRPVEQIAREIDQLREQDLSVRLQAPDAPTELQPVIDKLNGLLSRLDAAFSRERAFTSDVAHELRTPLAALLTTFEVCRSRPREEADYVSVIDKCRQVTKRMQDMVETLLVLTRADAGQLSLKTQKIDAADLLDDSWAFFTPRAEQRNLKVQWQVAGPIFIESDPEKLLIIFQNIFDNAVSYANDSGSLRVTANVNSQRLLIEVANTGSRITPDEKQDLFRRFWRGDQARTDTGLHCGLGLSLCQRLARFLHGQIDIQLQDPDWFVVRLTLPATSISPPISSPPTPPASPPQPPSPRTHSSVA